jgi:carbamate kinase
MRKTILVALGGNAIKQAHEKGTSEEQFENVYTTCRELVKLLKAGYRLCITHGNGPQAGSLLIQQEEGAAQVPALPLDVVGAMTQGQIGYMFQQALTNLLWKERLSLPVTAIVNQVLVSKDDPDYEDPSKPVGPFFNAEELKKIEVDKPDWIMKEVKPKDVEKRFRRVVASPDPIRNLEYQSIRLMLSAGIVVVASGGGGVPVIINEEGSLEGTAAVIDKDLAGERLAEAIGADILLILTDVGNACINYGTDKEEKVGEVTYSKMKKYHAEGQFMAGSMGPKVNACLRFVEFGGEKSIITSLDNAFDAVKGNSGTQIIQDK